AASGEDRLTILVALDPAAGVGDSPSAVLGTERASFQQVDALYWTTIRLPANLALVALVLALEVYHIALGWKHLAVASGSYKRSDDQPVLEEGCLRDQGFPRDGCRRHHADLQPWAAQRFAGQVEQIEIERPRPEAIIDLDEHFLPAIFERDRRFVVGGN